jgi:flavin reductase
MKIQQGKSKRKEWFIMSKKVRIISSSPRRGGNSETLAGTVFAGGVNGVGEIAGHPALEQAYQMGKEV